MANPDQKTILYDEVHKEVNQICIDFQENCGCLLYTSDAADDFDCGATDDEVKELLREILARWGKTKL